GEMPLDDGHTTPFVVRVGETVRKPWTASTDSVQRLVEHLRECVGDLVPEPWGSDEAGRQVWEFVPGTDALGELPLTTVEAERVGTSIRALHDAAASFTRRESDVWTTAMRRPGDELVSHNDLAPWNLIRGGERRAFIDWDGAGPTTRIADLAYAARSFAQLDHCHETEESVSVLRAILSGYGASADERAALVPAMIERAEAMRDLLVGSITTGAQPWASMAVSGHGEYWTSAAQHVRTHARLIADGCR